VSFAAIEEFFGSIGGAWKYVYAVAFIHQVPCENAPCLSPPRSASPESSSSAT
jgi:hypothetical protein